MGLASVFLFTLFVGVVLGAATDFSSTDLAVRSLLTELDIWEQSGQKQLPATLQWHLSQLGVVDALNALLYGDGGREVPRSFYCIACSGAVKLVFRYLDQGKAVEEIISAIINLCLNLGVASEKVCRNIIEFAAPEMLFIVMNTTLDLQPATVCGVMLQRYGCGREDSALDWTVQVDLGHKPAVKPVEQPEPSRPTLKVAHVSDLHYDPKYLVGGRVDCEDIMCCREEHGLAAAGEKAAGYWGEYDNCDAPWALLENICQQIDQQHPDVDYLLMTGDLPSHHLWATSREGNLDIIRNVTNLIAKYFPDTPVFPALGNHETHPINSLPNPEVGGEFNISWLYHPVAELWSQWLPQEVLHTIQHGGYYSVLARPGLRLIVINSNLCYCFNWWLLYGPVDPAQQLEWLAGELLAAERRGEIVHLVGHVPPGHRDCFLYWSREFDKLINRFEGIIAAQFYGHSHKDELKIAYDSSDPKRAISVGYVSVSATPWHHLNPGYRIYHVDGDYEGTTRMVLDHDTYVFNLTKANLEGSPSWYKLYSAKQQYQLESLTPQAWDKAVHRMAKDDDFFQLYYRNFAKDAAPFLEAGCDVNCKEENLCRIVTSDWSDQRHCNAIKQEINGSRNSEQLLRRHQA